MRRGYIRTVRGNPAKKQRAELKREGIEVIYDDLPDAVASLRPDDVLILWGGLHILSSSRRGINEIIYEIHGKNCVVVDADRNESSFGDGIPMLANALDQLAYEKRFGDPKKAGAKGAAKRWAGHKPKRTGRRIATGPWKDRHLTTEQALTHEDMKGWTRNGAYRFLGNRGIFAGRMPKE